MIDTSVWFLLAGLGIYSLVRVFHIAAGQYQEYRKIFGSQNDTNTD